MIKQLIEKYLQIEEDSVKAMALVNPLNRYAQGSLMKEKEMAQSILKDLRELEGKMAEIEKGADAAALEYAQKASAAPDKETPEWVCTDFKAGMNYIKNAFENQ